MAWSASTLSIKDAAGTTQTIIAYTDGMNFAFANPLLDTTGAQVAPATSTLQTTGNTSLSSIVTNTNNILAKGSATSANSSPVVIASDQGAVATTGTGSVHPSQSVTVTAGAYSTGYVVGGLLSISNAARVNAGSGTIQSVVITVKTALTAPYDVLFFDTNPSNGTYTDNQAFALNTTDMTYCCGVAHCTDLISGGTPQILQAVNCAIPFKLSAAATTLYAIIVIRGAQTYASTSAVNLSTIILQD